MGRWTLALSVLLALQPAAIHAAFVVPNKGCSRLSITSVRDSSSSPFGSAPGTSSGMYRDPEKPPLHQPNKEPKSFSEVVAENQALYSRNGKNSSNGQQAVPNNSSNGSMKAVTPNSVNGVSTQPQGMEPSSFLRETSPANNNGINQLSLSSNGKTESVSKQPEVVSTTPAAVEETNAVQAEAAAVDIANGKEAAKAGEEAQATVKPEAEAVVTEKEVVIPPVQEEKPNNSSDELEIVEKVEATETAEVSNEVTSEVADDEIPDTESVSDALEIPTPHFVQAEISNDEEADNAEVEAVDESKADIAEEVEVEATEESEVVAEDIAEELEAIDDSEVVVEDIAEEVEEIDESEVVAEDIADEVEEIDESEVVAELVDSVDIETDELVKEALDFFAKNVEQEDQEENEDNDDVAVKDALDFFMENVQDDLADDLPTEVKISDAVASAVASRSTYVATRESLKDAKARAQKRLSRTAYEKEKAADKIAQLQAKAREQTAKLQAELEEKLKENQASIDEEMMHMQELLQSEINLESQREAQMVDLISSLEREMVSKQEDIKYYESVSEEMDSLQSKLKDGPGKLQIQELMNQKVVMAEIERGLLDTLNQCRDEMNSILKDARSRAARTQEAKNRLVIPETKADTFYEWTDIEEIEKLLENAAESVMASEARVLDLRSRIDEALLNKAKVQGEEVPEQLKQKEFGLAVKKVKEAGKLANKSKKVYNYSELKNKDQTELLGVLGSALGKTAVGATKAAAFGIKALFDAVTDEEVKEDLNEVMQKSSGLGKEFSTASKNIKTAKGLSAKGKKLKDPAKSTGKVLGAVGKTGKDIVTNIGKKQAAQEAGEALKETSNDLFSSINAVTALTTKYILRKRGREE